MNTTATRAAPAQLVENAHVPEIPTDRDITTLVGDLDALSSALDAAERACGQAATRLLPESSTDNTICGRYQAAAARWPASNRPSHERLAAAWATVHAATDAVRVAARRCRQAEEAVAALGQTAERV